MFEIIIESAQAILFAGITLYLIHILRRNQFGQERGLVFIIIGFALLSLNAVVDLTDNLPGLSHFLILGNTDVRMVTGKIFSQTLGILFILWGTVRWVPAVVQTRRLQDEVNLRNDQLQHEIVRYHQSELKLTESERNYRSLVESANNIILRWGSDARITYINQYGEDFFGFLPGELIGQHVVGTIVPETETTGKDLAEMIRNITSNPSTYALNENENILASGERRWIQWSNRGIEDDDGNLIEILSIGTDITDSKQARDALEALAANIRLSREEFLRESVRLLSRAYNTQNAMIGLFAENDHTKIRSFAFWSINDFVDNIDYPIKGTPCEQVLENQVVFVPRDVCKQYPRDEHLIDLHVESYFGAPLTNIAGEIIGLVNIFDNKALHLTPWTQPVIEIFADRIAAELEKEKIDAEQRLAAEVFINSNEGIVITDQNFIIRRVNQSFSNISGFRPSDIVGQHATQLTEAQNPPEVTRNIIHSLRSKGHWWGEVWSSKKDGDKFPAWLSVSVIKDKAGDAEHYIGIFTDITEQKNNEEYIYHLAHYDTLTNMPNRVLFQDRLKQAIKRAHRDRIHSALLYIDLDRFKPVNDSYGHNVGDKVLIEIARRLMQSLRDSDTLARMGGDEFALIINDMSDRKSLVTNATHIAENILKSLQQVISASGKDIFLSASIGIATYPDDALDEQDLVKHADTAMYHAKRSGKNTFRFFEPHMNAEALQRLNIESDMRKALGDGHFELYYQPTEQIGTKEIYSVEGLLRWNHPSQGLILPDIFIPVAEESGLIIPLGYQVLEMACAQLMTWIEIGYSELKISVNLSLRQIKDESLTRRIQEILDKTGLSARHLILEITETTLMDDVDSTIDIMNNLRKIGISLSIDDFGTGYSSLSQLKRLPVSTLKIDKSFVQELETHDGNIEITSATIAMAHQLGLNVIAEGVEDKAQLNILKNFQCDLIQGYLISQPITAGQCSEFLAERSNGILQ